MKYSFSLFGFSFLVFFTISCGSKDDNSELQENDAVSSDVPSVYSKIYSASDIYLEGAFVVIEVNGVPDHNMNKDHKDLDLPFPMHGALEPLK